MKVAVSFILLPYFRYLIFISYLLIFPNLEFLSYHLYVAVSFILLLKTLDLFYYVIFYYIYQNCIKKGMYKY